MRIKLHFNMVEILLALGVCAIGVCSVMVLFPVGASASRDAAMETYAANAADQMLHLIKYHMADPTNVWGDVRDLLPPSKPSTTVVFDDPNWNPNAESDSENIFGYAPSNLGLFQVISNRGATHNLQSEDIDFRAIMFIWRSDIVLNGVAVPSNIGVTLNAEVTWPAEIPYDARQKALYCLEVFNPN